MAKKKKVEELSFMTPNIVELCDPNDDSGNSSKLLSNLLTKLTEGSKVVIMFSAEWCPPCKTVYEQFEVASNEDDSKTYAFVNINNNPAIGITLGVKRIPWVSSCEVVDGSLKVLASSDSEVITSQEIMNLGSPVELVS